MIARIWSAYRAELMKVARRRIAHAALAVALAAVLGAAFLARLGEATARLQGEKVEAANGFVVLADCLAWGTGAGAMVLLIFAGLSMAEEMELGTAKIVFSKPLRRRDVVLGKGLVLLTLSIALVALVAAAGLAAAGLLYGFGDLVQRNARGEVIYVYQTADVMWGHVARTIPLVVPPLFAALMLAFLMSSACDQSGLAVGLAFALLVTGMIGTWIFDRARPWLLTTYFGFATEKLRDIASGYTGADDWGARWPKGPPKVALALALSGAYALAAWIAAAAIVSRRLILALCVSASVATALAGGEARAGSGIAFDLAELEVPAGQVWDVTPADLDGDGKTDLVAFHVTGRKGPEPRRFLSIFYGRGKEGLARKPDQTLELDPEACVRFLADVDPAAPGLELGFVGPRGAFAWPAASRRYRPEAKKVLFSDDGFFDLAAGVQCPSWDSLARDMNGDGRADVLFPKKGAASIWLQSPGGAFARAIEVPLGYRQYFGTRIETLLLNRFLNYWSWLSRPVLSDLDGNRKLDLVTYDDGALNVYLQRSGGLVTGSPFPRDPDRRFPLETGGEAENGGRDDSFNQVKAQFHDLDADGLADLILYRNLGKIGLFESMRTQVVFYRATRGEGGGAAWRADAPDQILNLKGLSMNPALVDMDGDGRKDLVVSSLRTDLMTNAKRALFSEVTVTYYVFRWDAKAGRFRTAPDYSRDLTIDIARIEGGGTIPLALFWGDYDGDGIPDLLSLEENDRVRIVPGKVEKSWWSGEKLDFDEDDEVVVEVETSNSYEIGDFNGDGKSDFVFWYTTAWETEERSVFRAALSR